MKNQDGAHPLALKLSSKEFTGPGGLRKCPCEASSSVRPTSARLSGGRSEVGGSQYGPVLVPGP